jgi:ATP-dependent DNA helicase RecQ
VVYTFVCQRKTLKRKDLLSFIKPLLHKLRILRIMQGHASNARRVLAQRFKHANFRAGQLEVVTAALEGQDVLAVMPTGAGKSLTYQLPAVMQVGLTLVISPLIALMKDQVDVLKAKKISAAMLNSSQSIEDQAAIMDDLKSLSMLYLAPERLRAPGLLEALKTLKIARLVIDEAHCVSSWGHDFRPDYLALGEFRKNLGNPPVTALTATATTHVQDDIVKVLEMQTATRIVTGFDRVNLNYRVTKVPGENAKREALQMLLERMPRPGLVYVGTRKEAEELSAFVNSLGIKCSFYHGARETSERDAVQDAFMSGKLEVVIATNAFGMGVDKANVRFVIHYRLPGTVEAYYQEAGRAGRDGKPSRCVLFFDPQDVNLQVFFINNSIPSELELRRVWAYLHAARNDKNQVNLRRAALERNLELPDSKLRVILSHLVGQDGLELLPSASGMLHAKISEQLPSFDMTILETLRQHRLTLLEEMEGFAKTTRCRRQMILEYFGEVGLAAPCGTCDVCDPPKDKLTPWDRRALEGVLEHEGLARDKLLKTLIEEGGKLATWSAKEAETSLQFLEQRGLILGARITELARAQLLVKVAARTVATDPVLATLELHNAGKTTAQIAAQLETDETTIQKRLLKLLEKNEVQLGGLVTKSVAAQIRKFAETLGYSPIAPLKAKLGAGVTEFEIQAVRIADREH